MILLSPEQLVSKGFESLLRCPAFTARVCVLGLDETHALDTWGASFRKSYRQIGFMRARMPSRVRIITSSATVRAGATKSNICAFLGFRPGEYRELRRSNVRRNVRPIFRFLTTGIGGWSFPDLDWLVTDEHKTVIFCRTIALGFRMLVHLWNKVPANIDRGTFVRLYNALNWPSYNEQTRQLIRDNPACKLVIATTTFMMGVDIPNIFRVVILGEPESTEEWLQWLGRAQRDVRATSHGECITYLPQKALETARGIVDGSQPCKAAKASGSSGKPSAQSAHMDRAMARILLAPCKIAEQNCLYENPTSDPQCHCETCTLRIADIRLTSTDSLANPDNNRPPCACSGPGELGCQPEPQPQLETRSRAKKMNPIPKNQRLTRAMRATGQERFVEFRNSIHRSTKSPTARLLPPVAFFPEPTMKLLLDKFTLITSEDMLRELITGRLYLLPHAHDLWIVITELRSTFEEMRKQAKSKARSADAPEVQDMVVGVGGATATTRCDGCRWRR